jgi:hypothetical protein
VLTLSGFRRRKRDEGQLASPSTSGLWRKETREGGDQ